ncbi:MAG: Translation initiation factor IF-2 [Pelotomaculum sp. PtaB.Bin013]|uniref:Translation initiation factor IF-2 n=1 Tax=Pelotomaculum isophthalicicum JI TaxID=947010 RepID=A0A9X4JTD5_9FIRM|nr:translation initiation factor IF-2 [Pelotomaculum isophthalicicum]MDF9407285.1 translation initiation factor IF-2 [Pelotomaculum isophthalicicum JI]OPX91951.1 MAG: Translation initiation factor IF-2 [Pelotomaculum sp. PtaB.Bin013]
MVKKRVHEIAKELNIESKEIINKLSGIGINVKSHMSALEDSEVERLLRLYRKETPKNEKPAPEPAPAVSQEQKVKNKSESSATEFNKTRKTGGQQGDQRKGGKTSETNYYRGPGLVDRVPSRPPDRRFEEKPVQGEKTQVKSDQGAKGKTFEGFKERQAFDRPRNQPQGNRTDGGRPERPSQDRMQNSRPQQEGGRQERPPQSKQQQNRPPQNNSPAQRYDRGKTGPGRSADFRQQGAPRPGSATSSKGTGPQRWSDRGARPGGQPGARPGGQQGTRPGGQPGARPRPVDRPAQSGANQGSRIKTDLTVTKPQGRRDDKERTYLDKPKTQDKPKSQVGRPGNKGRYDKRAVALDNIDEKPRLRAATGGSRKKGNFKNQESHQAGPAQPVEKKPVVIGESITVQELAVKIHKTPAELIKKLMQLGVLATINQEIDSDTASLLAVEFGYEVEVKLPVDLEALLMQEPEEDSKLLAQRPCIVTVMGHVDHGKTSLLDAIRQTNVTATEAGGITQHIGAYQVEHSGKRITFVDTPGHEAFTAMRARGAQVTDIAILVVAAEDGVMPQTIEAINHAKEAEVPIIVAINKMDKPGANPERVKQELTEHGLIAEEWGGDTICVNVSAVKREGLKDLLEMILLVAEMKELKANPERPARGTVIEAELDKGRGPVATVLVQNGTLMIGDNIIAGSAIGRVRAMIDDKGRRVKKAGPSTPVEVLGFSETPMAGDVFIVVQDEKLARNIVSRRQIKKREEELKNTTRVSLDDLFKRIQEGQIKELGIIVKADVQGSVEALRQALERLNTGEVKVNIIHGGVGAISETDIMLASASNAIILGFNVRPDVNARKAAENEKVDVRLYRVIYEAIEDVKAAMSGLLEPEYKEVAQGRAEIRKIFKASKIGTIAGCYVLEGKIERDAGVRLVRDGIVIHEGKLNSLKRFKDDVKEVLQGYECGLAFEKFNEMQEGDVVEAFTVEAVKRELA